MRKNRRLLVFFSYTKSKNRRVEQVLPRGNGTSGEEIGKRWRRVNMVQTQTAILLSVSQVAVIIDVYHHALFCFF
jgi:hypothetical protein